MSCGASMLDRDLKDGIEKNYPCVLDGPHDYHRTHEGVLFGPQEDWRYIEAKMFKTRTGIYSPEKGFLIEP